MNLAYRIEYDEAALDDLLKLPKKIQQQTIKAVLSRPAQVTSNNLKATTSYFGFEPAITGLFTL